MTDSEIKKDYKISSVPIKKVEIPQSCSIKEINKDQNLNFILFRMLKKLPKDFIRHQIRIRERHINSLLSLIKGATVQVEVLDGFINLSGIYEKPVFKVIFNQNLYLSEQIDMEQNKLDLAIVNNSLNSNEINSIRIFLSNIRKINKYIDKKEEINILRDMSIDKIEIKPGFIILSSKDKIDIVIREQLINYFISEEILVKEDWIESLKLTLSDGYINLKGRIRKRKFEFEFDKNIKVRKVDISNYKYIDISLDNPDESSLNDKIFLTLYLDKTKLIRKLLKKDKIKKIIQKFILTKKHRLVCSKDKRAITIYFKYKKKI